jgi:hypothetical protein
VELEGSESPGSEPSHPRENHGSNL